MYGWTKPGDSNIRTSTKPFGVKKDRRIFLQENGYTTKGFLDRFNVKKNAKALYWILNK